MIDCTQIQKLFRTILISHVYFIFIKLQQEYTSSVVYPSVEVGVAIDIVTVITPELFYIENIANNIRFY